MSGGRLTPLAGEMRIHGTAASGMQLWLRGRHSGQHQSADSALPVPRVPHHGTHTPVRSLTSFSVHDGRDARHGGSEALCGVGAWVVAAKGVHGHVDGARVEAEARGAHHGGRRRRVAAARIVCAAAARWGAERRKVDRVDDEVCGARERGDERSRSGASSASASAASVLLLGVPW